MVAGGLNGRIRNGCPKAHLAAKVEDHVGDKIQAAEDVDHLAGIALKSRRSRSATPIHIQAKNILVIDDDHLPRPGEGVGIEIDVVVGGGHLAVGDHTAGSGGPVRDVCPVAAAADPVVVGGG